MNELSYYEYFFSNSISFFGTVIKDYSRKYRTNLYKYPKVKEKERCIT